MTGRATRLSQYLVGLGKTYTGVIRLGETTDTDDVTGTVIQRYDSWPEIGHVRIHREMHALTGCHAQVPPPYSAKKTAGERAHRRARRGEVVELAPQTVHVSRFAATEIVGADIGFRCEVSSGTYVRALARDLGTALGCGAHLRALRRESVGGFRLSDATTLDEIERGHVSLGSPADVVRHLPVLCIDEDTRRRVSHGQPIAALDIDTGPVALLAGDDLVAVAERSGDLLKPRVVLEG